MLGEIQQLASIRPTTSDDGTVEGEVTVEGGGSATISFRAEGRSGLIEMQSITVDDGGAYSQILPAGTYEVVASSDGMETLVYLGVEIDAGNTTPLDIDILMPMP